MDIWNNRRDLLIAIGVVTMLMLLVHALRVVYYPCQYAGYDSYDKDTDSCLYHSRVDSNFLYGAHVSLAREYWKHIQDKEKELKEAKKQPTVIWDPRDEAGTKVVVPSPGGHQ